MPGPAWHLRIGGGAGQQTPEVGDGGHGVGQVGIAEDARRPLGQKRIHEPRPEVGARARVGPEVGRPPHLDRADAPLFVGGEQPAGHLGPDLTQSRRRVVEGIGGAHRHLAARVGVVVPRDHEGRVLPLRRLDEVVDGEGPVAAPPGDRVGDAAAGDDRCPGRERLQAVARDDVGPGGLRSGQLCAAAGGDRDPVPGLHERAGRGPAERSCSDDGDVFHVSSDSVAPQEQ